MLRSGTRSTVCGKIRCFELLCAFVLTDNQPPSCSYWYIFEAGDLDRLRLHVNTKCDYYICQSEEDWPPSHGWELAGKGSGSAPKIEIWESFAKARPKEPEPDQRYVVPVHDL